MLAPVTLLVISTLSSLVTLGVLGSLLRSGIAGIRELMWANVLVLCSLLLFTLQANPAMPPWLAIQAPNVLISSGVVLFCAGVFRFMQQRPPWRLLLGLALSIGANIWFHYVDPSVNARVVAASGLHALLWGGSAWTIYRNMPLRRSRYSYWFAGVTATVAALGHALRTAVYGLQIEQTQGLLQSSVWNVAFLAIGVLVMPSMTLGMIMMIHDRMLAEREREANQDFLTGLLSRKAWWREGERLCARALRTGRPLTLLALDIDRFKQINDQHGHAAGDVVLRHFGSLATALLRSGDVIGRLGGEEFVALLPDTDGDTGVSVAERLLASVRATPCSHGGKALTYTLSGGVAQYRAGDTLPVLVERADAALYAAKQAGRDRIRNRAG
ncbi:GGDEF domain-containing protein [Bordetella parapertussis]|uniref:diguanylate cyclase n=1 Tax=Bordetella parapertussis (strain Bpp5) TaxID=1208660 RepID=K0MG95_BORPB|nr:GGDEF domain-containing protein [Bordetella parapertussis]CCJ49792.1 probable membrane protein [Bordetella parapertussis Bpp5]